MRDAVNIYRIDKQITPWLNMRGAVNIYRIDKQITPWSKPVEFNPNTPNIPAHLIEKAKNRLERAGLTVELNYIDYHTTSIKTDTIDIKLLSDLIISTIQNAWERHFEPHVLIIGPKQYSIICRHSSPYDTESMTSCIRLPVDIRLRRRGGHEIMRIMDYPVIVNPLQDGVVLVPRGCLDGV